MPYPFNDMQGGAFGPPGGTQNLGGGMGPMTDRDLQMLLGQLSRSQSPTGGASGGTLPAYDSPAPRGGPAAPQGVPGLGTTGIDPSMMAGAPPAPPTDFGVQDIAGGMQGTQQALMNIGMEERRRRLAQAAQGGGMQGPTGFTPNNFASGLGNDAGMGYVPRRQR